MKLLESPYLLGGRELQLHAETSSSARLKPKFEFITEEGKSKPSSSVHYMPAGAKIDVFSDFE